GAGLDEVAGRTLEARPVGEDREAGGAAQLVGAGKLRRVEIGADEAFGRARLLHLGDQRVLALGAFLLERGEEAADRWRVMGRGDHLVPRTQRLGGGDLFALVEFDSGEDVGHYQLFDTAMRASSFALTRPESMASAARATPAL